jgi:glycine hydroxymethyltransferase
MKMSQMKQANPPQPMKKKNSLSKAAQAWQMAVLAIHEEAPEVAHAIKKELDDQRTHLKLIASENFSSLPVQLAMGNLLTDKYSEGYPGHRFYAGCENVDTVESLAAERAKKLFGADHAYVQPHSGADANLVAYWAILTHKIQNPELVRLGKKNLNDLTTHEYDHLRKLLTSQKILGLALGSGGHLTHGFRQNVSGKMFQAVSYDVDPATGLINYETLAEQVEKEKPLILIAGYSAYSRLINFAKMRRIADSVNAALLVDMAHFAGLVAGGVMTGEYNPVPYADIVTSTTHKTLRGPRGGLILCKEPYAESVNKGCPLVLGGPLPHVMAAKAIAFQEALQPSFAAYARQVVLNAQALAASLTEQGAHVLTGGTDNHLLVVDVMKSYGLTGLQAEPLLRKARITVNRNSIPRDPNGAWHTSGIRLGTPALTTLGMKEEEMRLIGRLIHELLHNAKAPPLEKTQMAVLSLLEKFPLYPELNITLDR